MAKLVHSQDAVQSNAQFQDYLVSLGVRVAERHKAMGGEGREQAFTSTVLDTLTGLGQVADAELCNFNQKIGRAAGKINAWNVDEDNEQVDLVTTIFENKPNAAGRKEIVQAVTRAAAVYKAAAGSYHMTLEAPSPEHDMMERLYQVSGVTDRVRVIVLVYGFAPNPGEVEADLGGPEVQVDVWDLTRLYRAESSGLPYEPIEINIAERLGKPLECIAMPANEADYGCYLAVVPGSLLHSLYQEFGPRLLELNVRSFLQAKGSVNKGIRETLKSQPARFLAYNNGISATAENVDLATDSDGRLAIRSVTGLQIVNGGQTVASIHRALEKDGYDLSSVYVQAKLTLVRPEQIEELVPNISRYANTQNKVNEADFSANHPFHVKLQQLSQSTWARGEQTRWFYERARGQYEVARAREGTTPARLKKFDATTSKARSFDKVDLARYSNAWNQMPYFVSRGSQKNFVKFMEALAKQRGTGWEPEPGDYKALVAQGLIYKSAEAIGRQLKFDSYRSQSIAYTVALLSYRTAGRMNLDQIWNNQAVSKAVDDTLREWMPVVYEEIIYSAPTKNVGEWCKKEGCWNHIRTADVALSSRLETELSVGQPLPTVGSDAGKGGALTPEDRENIARVMQVTAEEWIHLVGWGSRSGMLEKWQVGIATSLASFAATGWITVPSSRQAFRGVEILECADEQDGRLRAHDD